MTGVAVPQIEGRALRDVEELRVFLLAFDLGMNVGQRVFKIMCNVLVELLVLRLGNFRLGTRPEGRGLVDRFQFVGFNLFLFLLVPLFLVHADRQGDVVGIGTHRLTQLPAGEEIVLAFAQMQDDIGAASGLFDLLDGKIALPGRFPSDCLIRRETGTAGNYRHLVGNDEGGIEANTELANEVRILGLIAGQRGEEFAGTGFGNGTQMLDRLITRESDAVIGHRDRARGLVEGKANGELRIIAIQGRIVQRFKTQLVAGVRGVGDQLAQKNFLVAVQRVNHQVEQFLDFRLEAQRFLVVSAHVKTPLEYRSG